MTSEKQDETSEIVDTRGDSSPDRRKWAVLAIIGVAQLMVVLDLTVMNIALPSAQRSLGFSTVDRQWVVTAYALSLGSFLLLGGKVGDTLGRRKAFLIGLVGFAGFSALGGAAVNFAMLVTARACQGVFAALLVPAALSLLATTFTDPADRGKAFGVYGAIATAGGAVGLLIGGILTQYLSWRWTLYINLLFAGVAIVGGARLLTRQESRSKAHIDGAGVALSSAGLFCLVYGFSNAAAHGWHAPSTWGFLVAGLGALALFGIWMGRSPDPLLPPRIVLDRNRSAAYLSLFTGALCMFATLLFLTYYLQRTLGYSPIVTGLAFLPISFGLAGSSNLATIVLMRKFGPKLIVTFGLLLAAGGMAWLAQLGTHTGYASGILGPILLAGVGLGFVIAPSINVASLGVAPSDAGVASATLSVGQQLGASVGTSLLNTVFASTIAAYLVAHAPASSPAGARVHELALAAGYDSAFRWTTAIAIGGAIVVGLLFRSGPLRRSAPVARAAESLAPQ